MAAGGVSSPMSGPRVQNTGIPNTYSLAWRLGRAVSIAQQTTSLSSVPERIIAECGGAKSARRVFTGKIRSVESSLTTTAHSVGRVIIERLRDGEIEDAGDRNAGMEWEEVHIPFMNENLAVLGRDDKGEETVRPFPLWDYIPLFDSVITLTRQVLATVPDLIFLLDVSTGEAVGTQEYR